MAKTLEKSSCKESLTDEWYEQLLREVDYSCSFCDSVHTDVKDMENTVKKAYEITAESLKGVFDISEITKRWYGMAAVANEILSHARFLKETNQVCGVDLTTLEAYWEESLDRLMLHCPDLAKACPTYPPP
jgi:hypothetical protein